MPFIFILIACVIGFVIYLGWLAEKKRTEGFVALAARLGMRFIGNDNHIATRYHFLNDLNQGSNRYAANLIAGEHRGHNVTFFDYHYETHSTDSKGHTQTHHHWFSFFVLEHGRDFPELRVYPETFFSKIGQALGYADIDFESAEFSRKFTVRSPDKKFAYDVIHPRMMEYLLANPGLALEIEGPCLAIGAGTRLAPEQIEPRLNQLVDIRALFPEYLFSD